MAIANPDKVKPVSPRTFELSVTSGFDRYSVEHGAWTLSSVFQPVFSLSHMRAVGYEGLLRAHDALDRVVSPLDVFGQAARVGEAMQVDRLSQALHLENFNVLGTGNEWLFLNVHPGALTEPYHMAALLANLKRLQIEPRRVVLEVLEQRADDIEKLADAVQHFREHGFLIALDDFGAGHSNIERIWQLDPDIVKLDRVMLSHAAHSAHSVHGTSHLKHRRNMEAILSGVVSLLHEAGKLVLIEGVETEHEAQLALSSGADFVQGFFFGRPNPGLADAAQAHSLMSELTERFRLQTEAKERRVAPSPPSATGNARSIRSSSCAPARHRRDRDLAGRRKNPARSPHRSRAPVAPHARSPRLRSAPACPPRAAATPRRTESLPCCADASGGSSHARNAPSARHATTSRDPA